MIIDSIMIVAFALLLDLAFGDPKNRYHPTAWIGTLIAKLTIYVRHENARLEKLGGILIIVTTAITVLGILLILDLGISLLTSDLITVIVSIIVGIILLKSTIAIRGMENYALSVVSSLDKNNLDSARTNLSMIVKRNTENLDRNHVLSGVLESISENTVDGVTGPLFYYAFFGLPGAFVYRVVNTADSMIGYKTNIFKNVGWFGASCDSVVNYVPSRLTGLIMVVSAALLQKNWKESYRIMMRDAKKTESLNAGYSMAALAGALETKFEKLGSYKLGDGEVRLTKEHVYSAVLIMKITSFLFFAIVTAPIIIVLSQIGWWIHA